MLEPAAPVLSVLVVPKGAACRRLPAVKLKAKTATRIWVIRKRLIV
jgi:hypothetical protein